MRFSLPFLRSAGNTLVGLDIASTSVKMVELSSNHPTSHVVERYAIEPLPRDSVVDGNIAQMEAVAEAIRRAVRKLGGNVRDVAVALPSSAVITKKILLPAGLREQEMEVQVESEANQYIPFPLEEVNLDFQVIGPAPASPDDVEVLIAASRKEKVEDRVGVAELAGLKVDIVDVETYASQAAFNLLCRQIPEGINDKIFALIDIGANTMNVAILRNEQQVYSREQAFGGNQLTQDIVRRYDMNFEQAEAAKRSGDLPDDYTQSLLRPFLDNAGLEVSRALQFFFTSTQFNLVDYIVLSGGCATLEGLAEVVAARTQIETLVANPFGGMDVSSRIREKSLLADAPSLMVACGLALRRFDPS
jgi:type IV pilus assembly protein PilM